jgi:hypothetical protein
MFVFHASERPSTACCGPSQRAREDTCGWLLDSPTGAMNPSGNVLQQFDFTLELFSSGSLACALPRRSNHGERACFQPVSGMGSAQGAG